MKTRLLVVCLAGAALLACNKEKPADQTSGTMGSAHAGMDPASMDHAGMNPPASAAGQPAPASSALATGTKHEPPITPEKVATGHWYCDMGGSVHYSRADEGDGKCPLCSMKLNHKQ